MILSEQIGNTAEKGKKDNTTNFMIERKRISVHLLSVPRTRRPCWHRAKEGGGTDLESWKRPALSQKKGEVDPLLYKRNKIRIKREGKRLESQVSGGKKSEEGQES